MKFNIGITGTGSLIGQAIIKSIIRSDYKDDYNLIGFDYFSDTVGSHWCNMNFLLPDILNPMNKDVWVEELESIIIKEQISVLFAGIDFELPTLALHKERIEKKTGCKIIVSDQRVIEIGNDKYLTYKFLKENGLSHPYTFLPGEHETSHFDFPLIVKPRVGARSIGVYQVNDDNQLANALLKVDKPVIQELVGTATSEYTCGVIYLDGSLHASIVLKRSLKNGNTFVSEYRKDCPHVIYDYINEIAEKLKPFGVCNLQLRIDKEGIPKLFEINPRHSGTTFIRAIFGYNEVVYILKYLLEGIKINFELHEGRVMRYYEEAFVKEKL